MLEELEMIKILRFSPIIDRKRDKAEAISVVKKYFSADTSDRWSLLTKTYRQSLKLGREDWNKDTGEYFSDVKPKVKVRDVGVISGCMVGVLVELRFADSDEEHYGSLGITLVRESGPYSPDPDSPLLIDGKTVPPYTLPVKAK